MEFNSAFKGLNNWVYIDKLCVVKEYMTKYMPDKACEVSTKLIKQMIGGNT